MSTKRTTTIAESSRLALAAAEDTLAARRAEHEEALEQLQGLNDRLLLGDVMVMTTDLAVAEVAIERSQTLLAGAEAAATKAQRELVNADTTLAEAVAEVVRTEFRDLVPVKVTTLAADAVPDPKGPIIYVVQVKPGTNDGGELSGHVDLVFHRDRRLAPLDADEMAEACTSHGHLVTVSDRSGSSPSRDRTEDSVRIRATSVFPTVPVLPTAPDTDTLRYFAQGVAHRVVGAVRAPDEGRSGYRVVGDVPQGLAVGRLVSMKPERPVTGKDGVTRTKITVTAEATESRNYQANAHPSIVASLNRHVGMAERGSGRVETVTDIDIVVPEAKRYGKAPWTVTASLTLAYRIA